MTFSDKRVAEAVNKGYVAAWVNRGPGFQNLNFHTEQWIFQGDLEAYPTKNICTFFLTPQGKVFYYAAGSYSPEVFLRILETADGLRGALFDAAMKETGAAIRRVHLSKAEDFDHLREAAEEASRAPDGWKRLFSSWKATSSYRGLKHKHTQRCAWSLASGYKYFAELHRTLAEWAELPDLEAVRYAYHYGNDFTEETAESARIGRKSEPPPPLPPSDPKAARVTGRKRGDPLGTGLPRMSLGLFE